MINLTPSELARYDGSSEKRPVYVAIDGEVYDVSANRRIYGKGGSYNMMYDSHWAIRTICEH
jgi:predicted heme/steroid binding protein